jgi:hypothetical protein
MSDREFYKSKTSYRKNSDDEKKKYKKLPTHFKYDPRQNAKPQPVFDEGESWFDCFRQKIEEIVEVRKTVLVKNLVKLGLVSKS